MSRSFGRREKPRETNEKTSVASLPRLMKQDTNSCSGRKEGLAVLYSSLFLPQNLNLSHTQSLHERKLNKHTQSKLFAVSSSKGCQQKVTNSAEVSRRERLVKALDRESPFVLKKPKETQESNTVIMSRFLQTGGNNDPDVFEFLGFVAWYLFLVICCIVPTACAYRRRRMAHANRIRRQHEHHMQASDAQIYFTSFRFPHQRVEEREEESRKHFQEALEKTTMVSIHI